MTKHTFRPGDIIGCDYDVEGYTYFLVTAVRPHSMTAAYLREDGEETQSVVTLLLPGDYDYYPLVPVEYERFAQFCRYEIPITDLLKEDYPPECLVSDAPFQGTAEDLLTLIGNCRGKDPGQIYAEWLLPFSRLSWDVASYGHESPDGEKKEHSLLPAEGAQVYLLHFRLVRAVIRLATQPRVMGIDPPLNDVLDELKEDVLTLVEGGNTPGKQVYTNEVKRQFIQAFGEDDKKLLNATEEEVSLYRRFVEDLCFIDDPMALRQKAYACYGGNRAYACDWLAARDLLLRLTEEDKLDPFDANTLGYIYYYGRCNKGVPDYKEAFYWYSIGAAGGVIESRYKLADMFIHGYGVPMGYEIARDSLSELYRLTACHIREGRFDCKFADVALRVGNLYRDGIGTDKSAAAAFQFYLQAAYAIRKRREITDYYGDASVENRIQTAIEDVLPETEWKKPVSTVTVSSLVPFLHDALNIDRTFEMRLKQLKSGDFSLRIRPNRRDDDEPAPRLFITVPPAHLCGLYDTLTLKTKDIDDIFLVNSPIVDSAETFLFSSVEHDDETDTDVFFLHGEQVAVIRSEYVYTVPKEKKAKKKTPGDGAD